jgi:tetratricopeptide (TPR) repeat protein
VLYYDGRYSEALAHYTEVMRLAREANDERGFAHAQMWHAGCLAMMGQPEQALVEARQQAATLDRLGRVGESAQGHLFLGNMLADDKSTPQIRAEAIAELGKAIRLGAKAQDPRRVGWAFYHTAELLREEGRFKEALSNAQQARDTLARIGDRVGQAVSIKVQGQVAMEEGAYDRAEADFLEAHKLLQGLNNRLNEIDVVLRLAQLLAARGDRTGALRHVAELERLDLPAARSDLATQFEQLKNKLAEKENRGNPT